jgi:hypothetical protein
MKKNSSFFQSELEIKIIIELSCIVFKNEDSISCIFYSYDSKFLENYQKRKMSNMRT